MPLKELVVALGPSGIAALAAVAGAWVQSRFGRKVRLKVGDVEAEARTPEELGRMLRLVPELRLGASGEGKGP